MDEQIKEALSHSLGDPKRDFKEKPLTLDEIEEIIKVYSQEITKKGLNPDLRKIYKLCLEFLKKHMAQHFLH